MEIRSFADYLRGLDDAALLRLFTHRADLISPVPPDMPAMLYAHHLPRLLLVPLMR
jgi:hypothetical protein